MFLQFGLFPSSSNKVFSDLNHCHKIHPDQVLSVEGKKKKPTKTGPYRLYKLILNVLTTVKTVIRLAVFWKNGDQIQLPKHCVLPSPFPSSEPFRIDKILWLYSR
jgi:hypothetical protein